MAGGTAVVVFRDDGKARRYARDGQLVASLFDHQLVTPRLWRRHENPVGRILHVFLGSENSDQTFHLVVVWCEVVVGHGPVETQPVPASRLEIVGSHAQTDTSPVVGSPAQHAGAPPQEFLPGSGRIRFPFDGPSSVRGVEVTKRVFGRRASPKRGLIRPHEHLGVFGGVKVCARLQQQDLGPCSAQDQSGHPSRCTGPDDNGIVDIRLSDYLHSAHLLRYFRSTLMT